MQHLITSRLNTPSPTTSPHRSTPAINAPVAAPTTVLPILVHSWRVCCSRMVLSMEMIESGLRLCIEKSNMNDAPVDILSI